MFSNSGRSDSTAGSGWRLSGSAAAPAPTARATPSSHQPRIRSSLPSTLSAARTSTILWRSTKSTSTECPDLTNNAGIQNYYFRQAGNIPTTPRNSARCTPGAPLLLANYHALQVSLHHRMSHGFQLDFNYTFSKSIDISSNAERVGPGSNAKLARNQTATSSMPGIPMHQRASLRSTLLTNSMPTGFSNCPSAAAAGLRQRFQSCR